MKRELSIAAGLLLTHAYARGVEKLCARPGALTEDEKLRLKQAMETHCTRLLTLAGARPQNLRPARLRQG
jgi:hypothetical protein